jgi:hypothetical protein
MGAGAMTATLSNAMPPNVAAVFAQFPAPVRQRLGQVRALIFQVANESPTVGPLTETLKWGEPAYLTEATGSGSTIRLGWPKTSPAHAAVYFNCKTTLVPIFREMFPREFAFSGNRAILLAADKAFEDDALSLCLRMALTYHAAKNPREPVDRR